LTFSPANVTALVGEVLSFNFNPKNHSVTQSSFDQPCQPLKDGGFSSGFVPTPISPSGAVFELDVKDTKPLWFYCAQTNGNHCQTGMVGSVNA
jgi:plastocyanin